MAGTGPVDVAALCNRLCTTYPLRAVLNGPVAVVSPATGREQIEPADLCRRERAALLDIAYAAGALALRGFNIETPGHYENLMVRGLGLTPTLRPQAPPTESDQVWLQTLATYYEKAGRKPMAGGTVVTLPAADGQMQGPHIEMGWRSRRPRLISFWCEEAPTAAGETALFDMARAYREVDATLRAQLAAHCSMFPAFGECFAVDSVLLHPSSAEPCLNLWYYERPLADFAAVVYRRTAHHRASAIPDTVPYAGLNEHSLQHYLLVGGERVPLSEDAALALMSCVYDCATYFSWQRGDLLLIDNIRLAHARMPCRPPRRILSGFWDEIDVRRHSADPSLRADDCPPHMHALLTDAPDYRRRVLSMFAEGRFKV
jgi:alpha-ketoglutarate-dependent taurine dioxygenase